jgi:hypothetical protein
MGGGGTMFSCFGMKSEQQREIWVTSTLDALSPSVPALPFLCLYPRLFGVTQFMDHLVLCFHGDLRVVHIYMYMHIYVYIYI